MASAQSELAMRMAQQFGLGAIQFHYADYLILKDSEVLKLFMPRSKRIMGGLPHDRMIIGSLMFLPRKNLAALRPPSKKFEWPAFCAACDIANFPWLVPFCWLSDEPIDEGFVDGLQTLVASLPDDERGWQDRFGEDVFETPSLQTVGPLIQFLRKTVLDLGV
jgi:hypothetical protein